MSVNVSICCTTADKAWWFDLEMEDATRLRVKKKEVLEIPFVKLGQYHTLLSTNKHCPLCNIA